MLYYSCKKIYTPLGRMRLVPRLSRSCISMYQKIFAIQDETKARKGKDRTIRASSADPKIHYPRILACTRVRCFTDGLQVLLRREFQS